MELKLEPESELKLELKLELELELDLELEHAIVQTQALWTIAAFCTDCEIKRGKPHAGRITRFRVQGWRASSTRDPGRWRTLRRAQQLSAELLFGQLLARNCCLRIFGVNA